MTKLRAPLSFEDAITRVAGLLGWQAAASAIRQKERTLRNYSDPDTAACIGLDAALRLDTAYRAAGGEGAPLFEAYALQLEITDRAANADGDELARRAAIAAKEGGEAMAALIHAARPGAGRVERAIAQREVREGLDALKDTLPLLDDGAGAGVVPTVRPQRGPEVPPADT